MGFGPHEVEPNAKDVGQDQGREHQEQTDRVDGQPKGAEQLRESATFAEVHAARL